MTEKVDPYRPFSERTGLSPAPPQLKLGEVSGDLRRLIYYAISLETQRESYAPYEGRIFKDGWKRVAMDIHVRFLKQSVDTFKHAVYDNEQLYMRIVERGTIGQLFDFVELLVRHPNCSAELKRELTAAFRDARAAYRIFDSKQIAAIGTEEQAEAFTRAITEAEAKSAVAARKQLIAAGVALRNGDWAGCVRESIHAVEAMAVQLAPGTATLGPALKALETRGKLHGSLKAAFGQLYGYSSDQEGVRHALVFDDEARVDEADALFMLGACASFVSYLLARLA